jgi:transglutaminase-like putative cysteine protease
VKRRQFLGGAVVAGALWLDTTVPALAAPAKKKQSPRKRPSSKPEKKPPAEPPEAPWKDYDARATLIPPDGDGPLRVWLPIPWPAQTGYQRLEHLRWAGTYADARLWHDHAAGASAFVADWPADGPGPEITLDFSVSLRERRFDVTRRGAQPVPASTLRPFLRTSSALPIDGLVKNTATRIIGRIREPVAQGKAIYDWLLDTLVFDTEGKGLGGIEVEAALTDRSLRLRSDDICRCFVSLARAAGHPARLVTGLRVGRSQILSLFDARGERGHDLCARAEFFTPNYGWIPLDPADALLGLAQAGTALDAGKSALLKRLMFGFWDGQWMALSAADDLALPDAAGNPRQIFSKPYAERDGTPQPCDWAVAVVEKQPAAGER